jgi:branched-chain amino acid transport system substrate-binding protein
MRRSALRVLTGLSVAALAAAACSSSGSHGSNGSASGGGGGQVVVGLVNSLTGTNASAGTDTNNGAILAADVINGQYPNIPLSLGKGGGLPNLHGAKIKVVTQDTQSSPETAASDVSTLVTSDHAVGLVGAYSSSETQAASQRAERLQVPMVNGASSAPALTTAGLKWFFRVGPTDQTFGEGMFGLLKQQAAAGATIHKIAILHTNDTYGNGVDQVTKQLAAQNGYQVVADQSYDKTTTDLTPEILRIRDAHPDVLFDSSYTSDAELLVKGLHQFHYYPPAVLAYGAGFSDPTFLPTLGPLAKGLMSRAAWSSEIPNAASKAVAQAFQKKFGRPMTENSARNFTALWTLAAAINNAGSTDASKVQQALQTVNIPASQLIMPWTGVKFDKDGQNQDAQGIVQQVQNGKYQVVYPTDHAVAKVMWPLSNAQG